MSEEQVVAGSVAVNVVEMDSAVVAARRYGCEEEVWNALAPLLLLNISWNARLVPHLQLRVSMMIN